MSDVSGFTWLIICILVVGCNNYWWWRAGGRAWRKKFTDSNIEKYTESVKKLVNTTNKAIEKRKSLKKNTLSSMPKRKEQKK